MFFTIENRTDKEVGNVFPQVSCESLDLAHTIKYDEFSNFETNLIFTLQPKAKLTDVLSQAAISASGFLINEKIKNILSNFNLIEHKYYNCIIRDRAGKVHNYSWIHLMEFNILNKIDYNKSIFYTTEFGFRESEILITSLDDYFNKIKDLDSMWSIKADFIKFKDGDNITYDLFTIPNFFNHLFISENLAEELIYQKVSGFNISDTNIF